MMIDSTTPRSRRALLAGGLGGLAALVASALGRPLPTSATDGQAVVVGGEYHATSVTKFDTDATGQTALRGDSDVGIGVHGVSARSVGVQGEGYIGVRGSSLLDYGVGVTGSSAKGPGVQGSSSSDVGVLGSGEVGVLGFALEGVGVRGQNMTSHKPAILGRSEGGTGIQGFSVIGADPVAPAWTGVYGYAAQDANAVGVKGQTTAGRGIHGYATTGTAVHAQSADLMAGYALRAVGRVKLDKCAGVAAIASGTNSITVTPGIDLVSTSAVVATLQGNPAGTTTVKSVAVNATANTFTIILTANATQNVRVAWHVFG